MEVNQQQLAVMEDLLADKSKREEEGTDKQGDEEQGHEPITNRRRMTRIMNRGGRNRRGMGRRMCSARREDNRESMEMALWQQTRWLKFSTGKKRGRRRRMMLTKRLDGTGAKEKASPGRRRAADNLQEAAL
ncbi:hypothetical protein KEM55_003287 [Ascosphaera atra]|nr:hypothetical protein KEM55_003287 [Ascosphaera atra]